MVSAVICMSPPRVWHYVICHVFAHCLGSFVLHDMLLSLHEFAFEGQNMNFTANMLLTCILYVRHWAQLWLELFASTVCCYLSRILYLFSYDFLRRRRSFTSRKLYVCLQTFLDILSLDLVTPALAICLYMPLTSILPRESSCSGTFPSRRKI